MKFGFFKKYMTESSSFILHLDISFFDYVFYFFLYKVLATPAFNEKTLFFNPQKKDSKHFYENKHLMESKSF